MDQKQISAAITIDNQSSSCNQLVEDDYLIRLRKYYCSFDVKCHPKHASLEEQSRAWMTGLFRAHGLPAAQLQSLLDFRYARLACMVYPNAASDARSFTLVKLTHWIFLVDDLVDDPRHLGLNLAAARAFCSRLLLSMFGPSCVAAAGLTSSLGKMSDLNGILAEKRCQQELAIEVGVQWSREMQAQAISPKQYKRVEEAVVDYLTGVLLIVAFREQNRLPSLKEYIGLRRKEAASDIAILGCEFDLNMELDKDTLAHPLMQELHQASADQLNWINDVISFNYEYHQQDYINLLTVLHYENKQMQAHPTLETIDFEEALSQACDMIKAKDKDGRRLSHEISGWNPCLQRYVEAIHYGISGITTWSLGNLCYRKGGAMIYSEKQGSGHHHNHFKLNASWSLSMCLV